MCIEFGCFSDKEITQKYIGLAFTALPIGWCFCSQYFWFSDDFPFPCEYCVAGRNQLSGLVSSARLT